ncbi:MAG TPA: hypothetical protein VFI45_07075 [Candidatus Acidoferrum sp.]|nr:hypothetical protein [Candidatus Acidoferrum sp.]
MRRKFLIVQLFVVASLLRAFPSSAQDANYRIAAEISRLQQSLQANPVTDPELAPVASSASQNLADASTALKSGQLYHSLEKLLLAEDLLDGARFPVEKSETGKAGYPAFEAEWKTVSQTVSSLNQQSRARDLSRSPAVLRALTETATARCAPLLDGGRGFALSTKPADGLFYLGQAQGEAAFANFASSLFLEPTGSPFPLRSFLPELQALQRKVNDAFKPPRSIQLHQRFIALNSALKLAQELDAQKSYAGALYQYLEATRHFAMLDAPPVDPAKQDSVKAQILVARQKLYASGIDSSIAGLFLERAVFQILHAGGSASADEWRSAQVILDSVVPAYLAAQKPAATLPKSNARTVQLTLVRWPYT